MKRPGRPKQAVALALTWDGSRWPEKKLPPKARAFLGTATKNKSITQKLSTLFADDRISEIRICWVPRLKGGKDVLTGPFTTPTGRRLSFVANKIVPLGDHLGVVYRRSA